MSIGERIRSVRKARGLSQESLARGADISLNVVGKIENGVVRDPHISTLRGIAAALKVDIAELLGEPVPLDEASEAGPTVGVASERSASWNTSQTVGSERTALWDVLEQIIASVKKRDISDEEGRKRIQDALDAAA